MATFLALLSSALWGTADYHGGKLSKSHPAIAVLGVTQAIGLIFGIGLVIVTGDYSADAFGPALFNTPVVAFKLSISPNHVGVDKKSKSLKSSLS